MLEGDHVILRPMVRSDALAIVAAAGDGKLWELFYTAVPGPETIDAYLDTAEEESGYGRAIPLVVIDKDTDKILSLAILPNAAQQSQFAPVSYATIVIAAPSQNRLAKRRDAMKFNIEVDTTPEEVRRLMGLPDLSEVHEVYLEKLKAVADKGLTPDMVQGMIRNWVPMGDQSMDMIKGLMGGLMSGGLGTKDKK